MSFVFATPQDEVFVPITVSAYVASYTDGALVDLPDYQAVLVTPTVTAPTQLPDQPYQEK